MIDGHGLWLFLAGALVLNLTPGPDMAFVLATGAKSGMRPGVAAALGVGAGSLVWAVLTAAGLAALLATSQHALTVIRLAGGAYLIYLAIRAWRTRGDISSAKGAENAVAAFHAGALTNMLNPKVGLFYLAFLPAFANAAAGPVWLQVLVLGAVFTIGGVGVLSVVAFLAGSARDALARSPSVRVTMGKISACVFGALGLHLILARSS